MLLCPLVLPPSTGTDNELAVSPMEGSSLGDCTGCSGGKGRGGLLEGTRIERESQGGLEERESGVWEEGMGGEMGGKREADHCGNNPSPGLADGKKAKALLHLQFRLTASGAGFNGAVSIC